MPKAKVNSVPDDEWVPDPVVCQEFGITAMTLWRWDRDPTLNFPKAKRIRGRKYRDESELDAFDASRERDGGGQ